MRPESPSSEPPARKRSREKAQLALPLLAGLLCSAFAGSAVFSGMLGATSGASFGDLLLRNFSGAFVASLPLACVLLPFVRISRGHPSTIGSQLLLFSALSLAVSVTAATVLAVLGNSFYLSLALGAPVLWCAILGRLLFEIFLPRRLATIVVIALLVLLAAGGVFLGLTS